MQKSRSRRALALIGILSLVAACGDDLVDPIDGTPPATPTGLVVAQMSLTSVRVTWNTTADATSYVLERAAATNPGVFAEIATSLTDTAYTDAGLTEGVAYSYRVAAANADGTSSFSTAATITTGVAAATLTGNIAANRTLFADTVYTLSGYVKVQNGATLTIQPGTTIVGDTMVLGSSLWILRGADLIAEGTATDPIVFTSARTPGNRAPGDWGGIVIIGNGVINRTGATILTEGPASISENYAGGTDNADNSGSLRYVRIEFAGYDVSNGAGQELNGLSMYAVGSGTRLEYVQTLAGLDDSFEFWGGAVQGRYLISYEAGDDHFDWSEGYRGKLQYIVAFQTQRLTPRPGTGSVSSDPRGFEADGCDPGVSGCTVSGTGTSEPFSNPTIANFTLVGTGNLGGFPTDGNGMVLRRGTAAWLHAGIVARFKGIGCQMRDAFTDSLRLRDSLAINNMIFAENFGGNYDGAAAVDRFCQESKFAAANHRATANAADLFTSLNPTGLDWTPPASSLPTTGGSTVALPAARSAGFFGGTMASTAYVGAADPAGPKWWAGWSNYDIN